MKSISFNYTALILLLFVTLTSCKDDDQSQLICENGKEEIDGSCQCPPDKFQIAETCRGLNENEYWATMPASYPCRDTFLLEFGEIDTVDGSIPFNLVILNAEAFDGLIPVKYGNGKYYFKENTNFTELRVSAQDREPFCEINGIKTASQWHSKFVGDSAFHVKMYHRNIINEFEIIDSTELIFKKEIP